MGLKLRVSVSNVTLADMVLVIIFKPVQRLVSNKDGLFRQPIAACQKIAA
jgi:hypothetical protein